MELRISSLAKVEREAVVDQVVGEPQIKPGNETKTDIIECCVFPNFLCMYHELTLSEWTCEDVEF